MIGGKLVQSKTTEWRDVINPATQEVVAKVPFATREELTWRWPIPRKRSRPGATPGRRAHARHVEVPGPARQHRQAGRDDHARARQDLPDAEGEVGRGLEVVEHACSIANLQLGEYAENAATGIDVTR